MHRPKEFEYESKKSGGVGPADCLVCKRERRRPRRTTECDESRIRIYAKSVDRKCSCPKYETIKSINECDEREEALFYVCDPSNAERCGVYSDVGWNPSCGCVVVSAATPRGTIATSFPTASGNRIPDARGALRSCCGPRPRGSTVSGCANVDRERRVDGCGPAERLRDGARGRSGVRRSHGRPCQCKMRPVRCVSKAKCQCRTCAPQRSRRAERQVESSDGRRFRPDELRSRSGRGASRDRTDGPSAPPSPRSGFGASGNGEPRKNERPDPDADEVDGGGSAFRDAAVAENVLEYEISALEHGISAVEKSTVFGDAVERAPPEPDYENVRRSADSAGTGDRRGDRVGPEGRNSEDEVQYENVHSARTLDCGEQKAAVSRILSASANNLYFITPTEFRCCNGRDCPSTDFRSDGRSGTFPQYLQKEAKEIGLDGPNPSRRSSGPSGTVYGIAKKEMCEVKQQRLQLAQDEYKHLSALTTLATSRTSLCSSGSGGSARYDTELLRSDVALAKGRVARLRKELQQVRAELSCTQQGVDTLHSVEQKISNQQGCYNITEAKAIMTELRNIQKSLLSGEKEKAELMQSLAKLKDDLTRQQLGDASPETSTLSLPQEKSSTASQTDLCTDLPIGTRLAEITRMRLQYDKCRKKMQQIQQQLADLEDKVQPGQAESDKDRLLVFQEKEQLLRELRSITPRTRSKQEMSNIQSKCKRLEQDLNNAMEMSNRCIADRLRLHEEKKLLVQQLRDALKSMTTLESQLKNLSASTLSVSSSSSLGSLSTTSSKGSLSSGLSFTDIYGGPQCITAPLPTDKPIDMVDLHRRVERLLRGSSSGSGLAAGSGSQPSLSPRSSLSSVSPPMSPATAPPPSYDLSSLHPQPLDRNDLEERLAELRAAQSNSNSDVTNFLLENLNAQGCVGSRLHPLVGEARQEPPLSPISETPPPLTIDQEELLQSTSGALTGTPTSSGTNSRSVSAAVSDESVAGDSGVFEASCRPRESNISAPLESTAQVQIKLQYSQEEQTLYVGVQKIRNLHALSLKEDEPIYIRALILPAIREAGAPLPVPLRLPLPLPAPALRAQTLQLQACRRQHCLGLVQISLADFTCETVSVKWYNILSLKAADKTELESGIITLPCKEESSDESTLIASQTSTLTRNQSNECEPVPTAVESPRSSDDEDEDEEEENKDCEEDESLLMLNPRGSHSTSIHQILEEEFYIEDDSPEDGVQLIDQSQEVAVSSAACTVEKETNTECNFHPEGGRRRVVPLLPSDERLSIKRSQTFSPTPQLAKNQYICRLNRSESDSSMTLYRRGACGGATFDRHAAVRRSLRRGRTSGLPGGTLPNRTSGSHSSHAPRTSLDLELDLRAQHRRLDTLQQELAGLRDLKQRLEVAREKGDSTVANWATEDQGFVKLCEEGNGSSTSAVGATGISTERTERRAARALQRTCRDLYRLRRTRAPRGKPDLITFKEKMAFFTRYHPNVPILPNDEDGHIEHSIDTVNKAVSDLSQIFGELDCETPDSVDFPSDLSGDLKQRLVIDEDILGERHKSIDSDFSNVCGGLSDIQVGYQVRRSGKFKNVVEKSQMLEDLGLCEQKSVQLSDSLTPETDNSNCLRLLTERGNNLLNSDEMSEENVGESVNELKSVVNNKDKDRNNEDKVNGETAERYPYVVDRVLGVQV